MQWVRKAVLGVLAITFSLALAGCALEPAEPVITVRQTTDDDDWSAGEFPCGPPWDEEGFLPVVSDQFLEWTPDGQHIIFSYGSGIWMIDSAGTRLNRLVDANPTFGFFYGFHGDVSPDGTQVVFSACRYPWEAKSSSARLGNALLHQPVPSPDDYEIAVVDIGGGSPQRLTDNKHLDHFPAWSLDGSRIAYIAFLGSTFSSRDPDRVILVMAADGSDVREIEQTANLPVSAAPLAWSPDGQKLAFQVNEGDYDPIRKALYTVRLDGTELTRVAGEVVSAAAWSPDGQRLAVARTVGEEVALFTLKADGADEQLITAISNRGEFDSWHSHFKGLARTVSWSPDGTQILYSCASWICVVSLENGRIIELVQDARYFGDQSYVAAWSPDGMRIAVYTLGDPSYDPRNVILYTVNRDGSDQHILARGSVAPVAENSGYQDVPKSVASCSLGFVIAEPVKNPGLIKDCELLISVRDRLAGGAIINWGPGTPIHLWTGITVEGSPARVTGLANPGVFMKGSIPPELGRLTQLRTLNFSGTGGTGITGSIPPELGNLTNLRLLSLYNSRVSGSIPPELGNLTNLQYLFLGGSPISGSIPPELGQLTNLEELYLSWSELSGNIPPELGKLTKLRILRLGHTDVSGNIPSELGNLRNLQTLELGNTDLSGEIPPELGNLTELRWLELHNTNLSPKIPQQMRRLKKLERLLLPTSR